VYINKWHTFTACCLLQLLMGVQYCFSCAAAIRNLRPKAVAACVMITQASDAPAMQASCEVDAPNQATDSRV